MIDNKIIYQLQKIIDLQEENIKLKNEKKKLDNKNKKYIKNISELEEKILRLEKETKNLEKKNKNDLKKYNLLYFKYSIISDDTYNRNYPPSPGYIHTLILDVYNRCKHLKNKEYKKYMYDYYKIYNDIDILRYIHAYCLLNIDNIKCNEKINYDITDINFDDYYSDDDIGNNDCYKLASWIENKFGLKKQNSIDLGIFLKWKKF